MWARIEENKVEEITEINPEGRFHSSLIWKECPADTQQGDLYIDGEFIAQSPAVQAR